MDISNMVLTPGLIEHGYSADEDIRDSVVTLKYHSEPLKSFFGAKDKIICGIAFQHYLVTHSHLEDCQLSTEAGGLMI